MDMSATIAPKSDQLNSDDLISGPRTITVTRVSGNDNADQPVNISYEGDGGKPFRPCKSMRRVLVHCWGADATKYVGRSMTIYRDPAVTFGGMQVGGIRISHMTHIDGPQQMALTASKAKRTPYKVQVLKGMPTAAAPVDDVTHDETHLADARAAASGGKDAFRRWFSDNPDKRPAAKSIMDELQGAAEKADAARAPVDDDEELPM